MFVRAFLVLWIACIATQASPLRSDETVVFFPSFGWKQSDGTWSVELNGWVFERERRPGVATAFLKYLGISEDSLSEHEKENFRTRSRLFLVDAEHGKDVIVSIDNERHTLPETDRTGNFSAELRTTNKTYKPQQTVELRIERNAAEVVGSQKVLLLGQTGISVVSDIDDTIKISNVRDREKLLRNTFITDFQAAPGMSDLYSTWARQGAAFHYVSGSPIQLFPPLLSFLQTNKFPEGSFHLRNVNWRKELWPHSSTQMSDYKRNAIEPILKKFPNRKFILVGDSGESDPEIYGELARRHPMQIGAILIRDVTKDRASRYNKAFENVDREKWKVFDDPKDFADLPKALVK